MTKVELLPRDAPCIMRNLLSRMFTAVLLLRSSMFITALSEHLNQLSLGPPLYGGIAHCENINAQSGLKTRLPAIIRQHFACTSCSLAPRTPDPKLERSMVIKVTQNPTLPWGERGVEKKYDGKAKQRFSIKNVFVTQKGHWNTL